jgi:hypothetical protein
MGVQVREIYPGSWYLRITYRGIRKTKAAGSKERAFELARKLAQGPGYREGSAANSARLEAQLGVTPKAEAAGSWLHDA